MGRKKKYGNVGLMDGDQQKLEKIANSQTAEYRKVQRARIILYSAEGLTNAEIAQATGMHRNTVATFVTKYATGGLDYAMNDLARSGKPKVITDEEKAWVTNIACTKPNELGMAQELWTYRTLQQYIRSHCEGDGYSGLSDISHSTVRSILESNAIKPNKIRYYLERRDPEFETKMHDVLVVYKQIEMCFDENGEIKINMQEPKTVTISYDEKPGIQALENVAPDLTPTKGHGAIGRDYEYKRLGTLSLLAGIDLLTGEIIPLVSDTHKSSDFIEWLVKLDAKYPEHDTIQIILDNHSAHTSKETKKFLATKPGRFKFTFTPKHGSWLNLIESFFGKMAKQCLRGIRVHSKEELEERIYHYIAEINDCPLVYRWTYKMDEMDVSSFA
jgi:transposase